MKFIDLYKSARETECFKVRSKQFKMFSYLAKNNPDKYCVKWNNKENQFNYFTGISTESGQLWLKTENECPKYKEMADFKSNKNY